MMFCWWKHFCERWGWDVFLEPRDSPNLSVLKTTEQELRLAPSPHFRDKSLGNPCSSLTVLLEFIFFHVGAYIFYTHFWGYRYQKIRRCEKFALVDFQIFSSIRKMEICLLLMKKHQIKSYLFINVINSWSKRFLLKEFRFVWIFSVIWENLVAS